MVVAYHYTTVLPVMPPLFVQDAVARVGLARGAAGWTWCGWLGVEIFFVISGYVIALSTADGDAWTFVRRRLLRLAPAAWVCATISAVVLVAGGAAPPAGALGRWAASAALIPGLPQIDGAYWTLGVEIVFYAVVAVQLGRARGNRAAIALTGLLLACLSLAYWPDRGGGTWDDPTRVLRLTLMPHGCFFAIGIALASLRAGWRSPVTWATLAIGMVVGTVEIAGEAYGTRAGAGLGSGPTTPVLLFYAAVVTVAAAGRLQRPLERGLGTRVPIALGAITYPLYLLHQFAGEVVIMALRTRGVPSAAAVALTAAGVLAVAWAVARYAEPALRAWLAARVRQFRAPGRGNRPSASLPAG